MAEVRQISSILVIEPHARTRAGLEASLVQRAYAVTSAGAEGLGLIEKQKPDLLLLSCEIVLESADAFALCQAVCNKQFAGAVLMTSTQPTKQQVLKAARAGAAGFLLLPTVGEKLYRHLESVFAQVVGKKQKQSDLPTIDFGDRELTVAQKVDVIIKAAATVRAMPHAITQILRTTRGGDTGARDISKAAESDPAIAAMILKRANSSYYGGGKAVTDLQTAVVRLGFEECRRLVVGLSVFNLFDKQEKSFGLIRSWYWLHSLACGVIASEIARQANYENKEDSFSAGLLHDIGMIILDDFLPDVYPDVVRKAHTEHISIRAAEQEILSRDHTLVGHKIAEKWRFSQSICHAIADHHNHEQFKSDSKLSLPIVIYLANQMAKAMMAGSSGDFVTLDVAPWLWPQCGFHDGVPKHFLDRVYAELAEFCSFLQIKNHDIEMALERRSDSGTAVIVDENDNASMLLSLFLINQGFEVETLPLPEDLLERDTLPNLFLYRPADPQSSAAVIEQMASTPEKTCPTVCVVAEDAEPASVCPDQPWLRKLPVPLDCFDLICAIRELIPEFAEPQPQDNKEPTPAAS